MTDKNVATKAAVSEEKPRSMKTFKSSHRLHAGRNSGLSAKMNDKPESTEPQDSIKEADLQRLISGVAESLRKEWGRLLPFDNPTTDDGHIEESSDDMARIKQRIMINGKQEWITANNLQDFANNIIARIQNNPQPSAIPADMPLFGEYLKTFLETFKSRQQPTTVINRQRLIDKQVIPVIGDMPIGEITTAFCQRWFDRLCDEGYSKETLLKIKNSISPAFDSAVADGYIRMNPFKDKARFKINTEKGEHHKAIPSDLFQSAKAKLHELPERERYMMALLCYTGMRFEEVLGVRWEDIYNDEIHVERAVVHPKRNQPIVKVPKTKSSRRKIPVVKPLLDLLEPGDKRGYIVGGEKPLSYQQAKKSFEKARKILGVEGFTAHDFRDTCATVWRESGMQMEHISKLLGHAKTAVTEQCYVKFRQQSLDEARSVMEQVL